MRKAYFLLALAAWMLSLSGCAGSHIKETQVPAAENAVPSRAGTPAVTAAGAPSGTSEPESTTQETAVHAQMIYVGDACMSSTGRMAIVTQSAADGTIASVISPQERPAENGQANFDCQGSSYISLGDGAAAVEIGGSYILFLADDVVEYNGIYKKKSDVSEDTLKWLDFYYSMPEAERLAINMVPSEFYDQTFPRAIAMETDDAETAKDLSYIDALTEEELAQTEALAQQYFTGDVTDFEGVDQIYPVDSDPSLYRNAGLEGEYAPGNIIIYKVLTVKDRRDGNPFRFISVARKTKSDDWKIINCGY